MESFFTFTLFGAPVIGDVISVVAFFGASEYAVAASSCDTVCTIFADVTGFDEAICCAAIARDCITVITFFAEIGFEDTVTASTSTS